MDVFLGFVMGAIGLWGLTVVIFRAGQKTARVGPPRPMTLVGLALMPSGILSVYTTNLYVIVLSAVVTCTGGIILIHSITRE